MNISQFQIHDRCVLLSIVVAFSQSHLPIIYPTKTKKSIILSKLCKNFLVKFCIQFSGEFCPLFVQEITIFPLYRVFFHMDPPATPPGTLLTGPLFAAATAQGTFLVAGFSVSFIIVFLDITSCGSDGICRDAIHGRNKPPRTHRCPGRFCVFHMPLSEGEGIPHQRAVDHLIVLQNTLGHLRPIR
ncbi:hypothetical protein, partial [Vescimonas sp.]|uniref:hypothetical protein n=1 Tax=Vescimonas sp. TaxID=2892404 RepID=UPI0030769551